MLSDARESMNRVKKGVIKELFWEIGVFLVTKNRSSEILSAKMEIFFLKTSL